MFINICYLPICLDTKVYNSLLKVRITITYYKNFARLLVFLIALQ